MRDGVDLIQQAYAQMNAKHAEGRKAFGRPLTLTEKILVAHMKTVADEDGKPLVRKKSYANLYPDRVALQDATAQMALLQFMHAGKKEVAISRVEPVGTYAVQLYFSDGHDTGIYSWDLLYEYGSHQDEMWADYLNRLQQAGASRDKK